MRMAVFFTSVLVCVVFGVSFTAPQAFAQASIKKVAPADTAKKDEKSTEEADGEDNEPVPVLPPPPYDRQMLRLAEVLGSVHYLRSLCGSNEGTYWRDRMEALLTAETPTEVRKTRLIANFNRGYRAFNEVYNSCTESAVLASDRYMKEGAKLASEITTRYGG